MYPVTSTFLTKIKEASRNINGKVSINGTEFSTAVIVDFSVDHSFGSNNIPTIAGATSARLTLRMVADASLPAVLIGKPIIPSVAIETTPGVYEWVPLGTFYAETGGVTKGEGIIKIDAYDSMIRMDKLTYTSALTFPATVASMLTEIATNYGITFKTQTLPAVTFQTKPSGTVRKVLSDIAGMLSSNCIVNRSGQFEFRFITAQTFTVNADNYYLNGFKLLSDAQVKISQLTLKRDDFEIFSGDGTGVAITLSVDEVVDQDQLDTIFARVYPLSFWSYTLKLQGMPHLEIGDQITLTDSSAVTRTIVLCNHRLTYNGAMVSEFKVDSPKVATKIEAGSTGGSNVNQSISQSKASLMIAINDATKLISGNSGGTVITIPDENGRPEALAIIDTLDINTAQKMWLWNNSGLGFSETGYAGPYKTAITADGQINASFITTGVLTASIVKSGILQSVNGKSWIDMDTGYFSLGGMINFNGSGLTIKLNETQTVQQAIDSAVKPVSDTVNELTDYVTITTDGKIILGGSDSTVVLQIENNRIVFMEPGTEPVELGFFEDQKLSVKHGIFLESLTVGTYGFVPRTNGHLSFRKVK